MDLGMERKRRGEVGEENGEEGEAVGRDGGWI